MKFLKLIHRAVILVNNDEQVLSHSYEDWIKAQDLKTQRTISTNVNKAFNRCYADIGETLIQTNNLEDQIIQLICKNPKSSNFNQAIKMFVNKLSENSISISFPITFPQPNGRILPAVTTVEEISILFHKVRAMRNCIAHDYPIVHIDAGKKKVSPKIKTNLDSNRSILFGDFMNEFKESLAKAHFIINEIRQQTM